MDHTNTVGGRAPRADYAAALSIAATQFETAVGVGGMIGGLIGLGVGASAGGIAGAAPGAGIGAVIGGAALGVPVGIYSFMQLRKTLDRSVHAYVELSRPANQELVAAGV
jgi:hypothetical protein